MSQRPKAPVVKLDPHKSKILEALHFLMSEAKRKNRVVTQYMLVKALFLADRRHLNRFGRPVTFDNYVAMNHGPVPSKTYNALKGDSVAKAELGIKRVPWDRKPAPEIQPNAYVFTPKGDLAYDHLTESDLEVLEEALTVVFGLDFKQLRKITHEDPSYADAWENDGGRGSYPMSYGLLFDVPAFDKAEDLAFASRHS